MPRTSTFPIYDRMLGGRLALLLRRYRDQGLSYESIARALHVDHAITVTGKTVNRWFSDLDSDQGAA